MATPPLGDSTDIRYPANRLGATTSHSPWLAFAKTLKSRLDVPIGLISASLGRSPLSLWTRGVDGVLFDNMLDYLADVGSRGEIATGLLYMQEAGEDMHGFENTVDTPRVDLAYDTLCPGNAALQELQKEWW